MCGTFCAITITNVNNPVDQINYTESYPTPDMVDVIGFVLRHKLREQIFPGWDDASITNTLLISNIDKGLLVTVDEDTRRISGVVQYSEHAERNTLFVSTVITAATGNGAFKAFINLARQRWPGWKIEAFRRRDNKLVTYNFNPRKNAHSAQTSKPSEEYATN